MRNSQQGKRPPKIIDHIIIKPSADTLKTTENPWKPSTKKKEDPADQDEDQSKVDDVSNRS